MNGALNAFFDVDASASTRTLLASGWQIDG